MSTGKFLFLFFVFSISCLAQNDSLSTKVDSLYREDQFYVSISYNFLQNKPDNFSQYSFSTGLSAGFLRDFPISDNRHWAIAPGIGYSFNDLKQNIDFSSISNSTDTEIVKSRIILHYVDFPLELRWRNATPDSHKFWRIYTGIKFSYLLYDKSVFNSTIGKVTINGNKDFDKFQYGAYISSGYNTVNLYAYYGLNSLFKTAKINGEPVKMKSLNFGIIFYIL